MYRNGERLWHVEQHVGHIIALTPDLLAWSTRLCEQVLSGIYEIVCTADKTVGNAIAGPLCSPIAARVAS